MSTFHMPIEAPDSRTPLEIALAKLNKAWMNYSDTLEAKKRHEIAIKELAQAQIDFEDQMVKFRQHFTASINTAINDLRNTPKIEAPYDGPAKMHETLPCPPFSDLATRNLK